MNADAAKPAADFSSDAAAKAGLGAITTIYFKNSSLPTKPLNPIYRTGPNQNPNQIGH